MGKEKTRENGKVKGKGRGRREGKGRQKKDGIQLFSNVIMRSQKIERMKRWKKIEEGKMKGERRENEGGTCISPLMLESEQEEEDRRWRN